MRIISSSLVCLMALIGSSSCNGNKKSDGDSAPSKIERFDKELYNKTGNGSVSHLNANGYKIYEMDFDRSGGFQKERLPKPSFYTLYKEFYPNGNLKKKEMRIGAYVPVGKSEYYDQSGNLSREINEDLKFGRIKPDDILSWLEQKGRINRATGEGGVDSEGHDTFELQFEHEGNRKIWLVTLSNAKPNKPPFDSIGEPPASLPLTYKLDGETGKEIK